MESRKRRKKRSKNRLSRFKIRVRYKYHYYRWINTEDYGSFKEMYEKYKDKGLVVLGFPCNQFGGQEPGTDEQIKQFCTSKYNVTFPMFDKLEVNGANRHSLYVSLAGAESPYPGNIKWNFTKFLVGRDGKILKRFESKVTPDSPEVTSAIEGALGAAKSADLTQHQVLQASK